MKKIKKALISVSNKDKLIPLLKTLSKYKIKLISSGGTYKKIKKLKFMLKTIIGQLVHSQLMQKVKKFLQLKIVILKKLLKNFPKLKRK